MSVMERGGAHVFIARGHTQRWRFTWHDGEWHGDTINEPRPLNKRAALTCSAGSLALHGNGVCSIFWSVTNHGPDSTFFSIQPTSY